MCGSVVAYCLECSHLYSNTLTKRNFAICIVRFNVIFVQWKELKKTLRVLPSVSCTHIEETASLIILEYFYFNSSFASSNVVGLPIIFLSLSTKNIVGVA